MNMERLLLLATRLDDVPPERFDFATWISEDWKGAPDLSCGAVACALGWGTTIPQLRDAGLELRQSPDRGDAGYVALHGDPVAFSWAQRVDTSLFAAMRVFDLTRPQAEYLFWPDATLVDENGDTWCSPGEHADPSEVAEHIRFYVEQFGGRSTESPPEGERSLASPPQKGGDRG